MRRRRRAIRIDERVWLAAAWLGSVLADRVWLALDRHVPDWDEADYVTGALNYGKALADAGWQDWFSGEWWTGLWLLSSKIPPLMYLLAGSITNWIGRSADTALWANAIAMAVLVAATYGLGRQISGDRARFGIGFWAALLVLVLPGLLSVRRIFVLDYAVCAAVAAIWWALTRWRATRGGWRDLDGWVWAIVVGAIGACGLMVKQTVVLFALVPVLWILGEAVFVKINGRQRWARFGQAIAGLWVSDWIWGGWYGTNWLLILTSGKRATVDSAIAEGDPSLLSLRAWTYYLEGLPNRASPLLLGLAIVGGSIAIYRARKAGFAGDRLGKATDWRWFWAIAGGGYLLCSLNVNKDPRYILPEAAILAIGLAIGLAFWPWRLRAIAIAIVALFSIGQSWPTESMSAPHLRAYTGQPYPHAEIVANLRKAEPFARQTIGVLPSTATVNQHNINLQGAIADFSVYGRQVGTIEEFAEADMQALSWFLLKTGDPGSVPDSYATIAQRVRQSEDFERFNLWWLPDNEAIEVYRQRSRDVTISAEPNPQADPALCSMPDPNESCASDSLNVTVEVGDRAAPGDIVAVQFRWSGAWDVLRDRVVLLGWYAEGSDRPAWIFDRAVAAGNLAEIPLADDDPESCRSRPEACLFAIDERAAMQIPADLAAGAYQLRAQLLDPEAGTAVEIPNLSDTTATITVDPDRPIATIARPALDLSQQLRQLASLMPDGLDRLDRVFLEIGRINQYDPTQDYLDRAIAALEYRLQDDPRCDWAYTVALAQLLNKRIGPAIAAFERITQLEPDNPYGWAYLAIVETIGIRPYAAYDAIDRAIVLAPEIREFRTLRGILALTRANLLQARRDLAAASQQTLSTPPPEPTDRTSPGEPKR
ncbi:MAG: hypothetical protein ACFB9N_04985 [Geitlerinemataceae cyanobacterium]